MLKLSVENIGDLAIVECEGRIVRSESAFKLRDVVTSQSDAHTVVIELSEVRAIEATMGTRSRHPIKAVQSI